MLAKWHEKVVGFTRANALPNSDDYFLATFRASVQQ
jgi:hypothetical protein